MNLHFDTAEFAPIIEQIVEAVVRRLQAERATTETDKILVDKPEPSLTAKECDLCGDVPATHNHVECEYGTRDLCDACYDEHVGAAD